MAVRFGTSGNSSLTRTADLPTSTAFTICGWSRFTTDTNTYACIAAVESSVSSATNDFYLGTNADGTSLALYSSGIGSFSTTLATLTPGDVFFWAMTCTGNLSTDLKGYHMPVGSNTLSSVSSYGQSFTTGAITLGSDSYASPYSGALWNVKCWDRVLTVAELMAEAQVERVMYPASLNFHLPLWSTADTADRSGNGRTPTSNGTLTTEDSVAGLMATKPQVFGMASAGGGAAGNASGAISSASATAASASAAGEASSAASFAPASLTAPVATAAGAARAAVGISAASTSAISAGATGGATASGSLAATSMTPASASGAGSGRAASAPQAASLAAPSAVGNGKATASGGVAASSLTPITAQAVGSATAQASVAAASIAAPEATASASTSSAGQASSSLASMLASASQAIASGAGRAAAAIASALLIPSAASAFGGATASAALATVSTSAPSAGSVGEALASAGVAATSMQAPQASAFGGGKAAPSVAAVSVLPPGAVASGAASASAAVPAASVTAPTASASVTSGEAVAAASMAIISLTPPQATAIGLTGIVPTNILKAAPARSTLKDLPGPPKNQSDAEGMLRLMKSLREHVRSLAGLDGRGRRVVIDESDVVDIVAREVANLPNGGGGAGGGAPEYAPDYTAPPTPSSVSVTAGLSYIFIETAAPTFTQGHGYARTIVYGAQWPTGDPEPVFAGAVKVHEFVGNVGTFQTRMATRWAVWLTWLTQDGVESSTPSGGANGHQATTGQDVDTLLEVLTGQIRDSELATALNTRINLIDAADTVPGSVAQRVLAEAAARGAAIASEATTREEADTLIASSVSALATTVSTNTSAISSEATARANADAAIASSITTLTAARSAGASIWPDPFVLDPAAWQMAVWGGLPSIVTITGGIAGDKGFRSPAGAMASARGVKRVPAVNGRWYRISALVRRSADANGQLFLRVDWGTTESGSYAQLYPGVPELVSYTGSVEVITPTTSFERYSWEFLAGSTVTFISPMVLLNHAGTAGYMEAQDIRIEDVTEAVALAASVTSESSARVFGDAVLASSVTTLTANVKAMSLGLPFEQWALNGQSLVTISDGKVGDKALRIAAGGFPNQNTLVPIDPAKTYRVKFWARPSADCAGLLYFCLHQFVDEGVSGPDNDGRDPYKPGGQSKAGHDAIYGSGQWGLYSYKWDASDWQDGAKFVLPEFLDNYPGAAGNWQIQGFTFTDETAASDVAAALQTESTVRAGADGHLGALYTVRVNLTEGGRTVMGGFGISGTSGGTAGATIDFGVQANKFWVGAPTGATGVADVQPFVVQTTDETVNGVLIPKGVYMDAAYIRNLTAMVARLGTAWIDNAMVANMSVTKLTSGSLSVGADAQAAVFVPGSAGWIIRGDGYAEFSNVVIRGATYTGTIYANAGTIGGSTIGSTYIQSTNWVNLTTGWQLKSDGTGQVGGIALLSDRIQSSSYVLNTSGFALRADGTGQIGGIKFTGNTIESGNYVANTSGFKMGADGAIEAQNIKARGDIEASSLKVDAANIVKTLNLEGDAVIVPRRGEFFTPGSYSVTAGYTAFTLPSIVFPENGRVTILIRVEITPFSINGTQGSKGGFILYATNGTTTVALFDTGDVLCYNASDSGPYSEYRLPMKSIEHAPTAGTWTYYVHYRGSVSNHRANAFMEVILFGVKK